MTVRELIRELLNYDLDNDVLLSDELAYMDETDGPVTGSVYGITGIESTSVHYISIKFDNYQSKYWKED